MIKIREAIETIGMKKICLFAHYGLAIGTSILFFIVSIVATFLPATFNISALFNIWKLIIIYCGVVAGFITIKCIFEDLQTIHTKETKFDFIAFFIGVALFVTIGLIIACIIFMFNKQITETEVKMWQIIIGIFGGVIFGAESIGGYIYNIFKKKFSMPMIGEETQEPKMALYTNNQNEVNPPN